MLEGVVDASERLAELAGEFRPALEATAPGPVEASFEVAPSTPPQPPPPPPVRVDPRELAWNLARHVSERFEPLTTAVCDVDLALRDQGSHDAEAVRVMRVSSRRLRSAMELFAPWVGSKRGERVRTDLQQITRSLGALRDLDGAIAAFEATRNDEGAPSLRRAAAEQILADLRERHARVCKKAHKNLRGIDRERLRDDLRASQRRILEQITTAHDDVRPALLDLLRPRIAEAFEQTPVPTTIEDMDAVHEVRIVAKRLRYATEWVRPAMCEGPGPRRLLKRAQRVVGRARDLALLEDDLSRHATAFDDAGLSTLAAAMRQWCEGVARKRSKADTKILPTFADLSAERVVRLTAQALTPSRG